MRGGAIWLAGPSTVARARRLLTVWLADACPKIGTAGMGGSCFDGCSRVGASSGGWQLARLRLIATTPTVQGSMSAGFVAPQFPRQRQAAEVSQGLPPGTHRPPSSTNLFTTACGTTDPCGPLPNSPPTHVAERKP